VIALANIESTSSAKWSANGATASQSSGGVEQAFSETLLAVTKGSSQADSSSDGSTGNTRRKKPEDEQASGADSGTSGVLSQTDSQQTAQLQQTVPLQQVQASNLSNTSSEGNFVAADALQSASSAVDGQPTGGQSNIAQPASSSLQAGNSAVFASADAMPIATSQSATDATAKATAYTGADTTLTQAQSAVANTVQNSVPAAAWNTVSKMPATVEAAPVLNAAQNAPAAVSQTPTTQSGVFQMDGGTSQAGNQTSSSEASGVQASPSAASNVSVVGNTAQNSIPAAVWNTVSKTPATVEAAPVLDAVQSTPAAGSQTTSAQSGVFQMESGSSQAGNRASSAGAGVAAHTDASRVSSPVQGDSAAQAQNPISNTDLNAISNTAVAASALDGSRATAQSTINQAGNGSSQTAATLPDAGMQSTDAVPNTAAKTSTDTTSSSAQSTVANSVQNSIPGAVLNAALNTPVSAAPVTAGHAVPSAPVKTVAPAASNGTSPDQAVPQTYATHQNVAGTDASSQSGIVSQLAGANQVGGQLAGKMKAGASSLSAVSGTKSSANSAATGKDAVSDATGVKQHTQSASDQTGSQSSTTSGDQSQSGASSQGQATVPVQADFTVHTVAAAVPQQSAAVASAAVSAQTHAGVTGSAMKATDSAATTASATPQAQPVINSAKLIQSVGQSEMRVGMRSSEFGNISISTSTTRDSISTQISLDHGELAKELAAHLPEIQARLGGDQAANVRIDTNGGMAGQGTGTSGSTSNGSADESRGGRQQSNNAASSYASNSVVERQASSAASAATTGYGSIDARLDIRV